MLEILAIGGVIIAGLFAMLGYKNSQIDDLEQENKGQSKKIDTQEAMKKAEIKAEVKEDEAIKDFDDSDWTNRI